MEQTVPKAASPDDDEKALERQGIDFVTLGMFIIGEISLKILMQNIIYLISKTDP